MFDQEESPMARIARLRALERARESQLSALEAAVRQREHHCGHTEVKGDLAQKLLREIQEEESKKVEERIEYDRESDELYVVDDTGTKVLFFANNKDEHYRLRAIAINKQNKRQRLASKKRIAVIQRNGVSVFIHTGFRNAH